jgi:hypothetical protein
MPYSRFGLDIILSNIKVIESSHRLTPENKELLAHIKDIGAENCTHTDFFDLNEAAQALQDSRQRHRYYREAKKKGKTKITFARYSSINMPRAT